MELGKEQLEALNTMEEFIKNKEPVLVLSGSAGTGKTTILNEFIQYLDSTDVSFVLCAPTHKAKLVMEEVTGYGAITLHKLLSLSPNIEIFNLDYNDLKFESKGLDSIPTNGIVIIDEASMVNDDIYKLVTEVCKFNKSKIIFIGDKCQLQPVNNHNISLVFNNTNIITLNTIHRQAKDNGLIPILTKLRENPIKTFKPIYSEKVGSLYIYNKPKDFIITAVNSYKKAINVQDVTKVKLVAYTNARVRGLNNCIRKVLWNDKEEYHQFEFLTAYENFEFNREKFYNSSDYVITNVPRKVDKHIPYYLKLPGYELELYDKVYDTLLPVFILDRTINADYINSLSALIEDIRLSAIEAKTRYQKGKASMLWKKYFEIMKSFASPYDIMFDNRVIKKKTFDYGYASTVHKLQGSSIGEIFIDMTNLLSCPNRAELRQLQYVALSRTKGDAHILWY